jgi:ribose transport system substrate-binding protein
MKSRFFSHSLPALFCAAVALAFAACGGKQSSDAAPAASAAPAKTIHLVYIAKGMQDVYWKFVEAGLRQAEKDANAAGTPVEVTWDAPTKDGDRDAQITMMQNYIAQKVDGIILCPIDDKALVDPVELANHAGIPVVIGDSALDDKNIVSFVRTDSFKGGQMAGDELARALGDKGSVILLRFNPGSASCADREAGFLDAISKHPNVKVISSDNYAGTSRESAQEKAQDLLNTYKGQVDGVFTPNESSTNGMLLALEGAHLAGQIQFVGFDGGDANVAGLRAGEIDALVLQNPKKIGYEGVRVMLDYLAKKTVDPVIDTGAALATKDNLDSADTQALLSLPKS